jgi:hypothetical protein
MAPGCPEELLGLAGLGISASPLRLGMPAWKRQAFAVRAVAAATNVCNGVICHASLLRRRARRSRVSVELLARQMPSQMCLNAWWQVGPLRAPVAAPRLAVTTWYHFHVIRIMLGNLH